MCLVSAAERSGAGIQPDRPRPYRAWGYPWVPAVYIVACAAVAGILLWGRPVECLAGIALLVLGVPFYAVFRRRAVS